MYKKQFSTRIRHLDYYVTITLSIKTLQFLVSSTLRQGDYKIRMNPNASILHPTGMLITICYATISLSNISISNIMCTFIFILSHIVL